MSDDTRGFFESRMGADFSGVRIHNDAGSAELSRDLNARAFTVGNNIAFNNGEYNPGTPDGDRLLAHELTHTIQQGESAQLQREEGEAAPMPDIPKEGGEPLDEAIRVPFEKVLGQPLDHVLIHTDEAADEAARRMGAQAFTVENHIYFAAGFFAPNTPQGDKLLAHELMHIVQNDAGRMPEPQAGDEPVSDPQDPLEQEAYGNEDEIVGAAARLRGEDASYAEGATDPPLLMQLKHLNRPMRNRLMRHQ